MGGNSMSTLTDSFMDDTELSKRAGTPSFLAPEVVWEYRSDNMDTTRAVGPGSIFSSFRNALEKDKSGSGSNSIDPAGSNSTVHIPGTVSRPPITKSIDVWALGVTLYCLLFARTPFHFEGDNAFLMYVHIANHDWVADTSGTMGYDKVPTGERHPAPDDTREGALVMNILDGILKKHVDERMTLDELKVSRFDPRIAGRLLTQSFKKFQSHPWITRDIPDPATWLAVTSPSKNDPVMVDDSETQSAMTNITTSRDGWHKRIKHRISSILHRQNVRPPRTSHSAGNSDDDNKVGSISAPAPSRSVEKKNRPAGGEKKEPRQKGQRPRAKSKAERQIDALGTDTVKEKRSSRQRPSTSRHESAPISPMAPRSKSIDRHLWAELTSSAGASSSSSSTHHRHSSRLVPGHGHGYSGGNDSYDASPESHSPTSGRVIEGGDYHMYSKQRPDEIPRSRFSYLSLKHWRSQRNASHESTATHGPGASTSTLASSIEPHTPSSPRVSADSPSVMGRFSPVVFARRASSWGEAADYEDVLSLNSGGEEDPLDREAVMLGAGGISNDPVYGYTAPIGFTSAAAAAASAVPLPLRQPQPERLLIGTSVPSTPDPAMHDPATLRLVQGARSQATSPSPLANTAYGSTQYDDDDSDDDDDGQSYGNIVPGTQYRGGYPDMPPSSSSIGDEDDDDSDESIPIEIRRRRPSVAVTAASPSPPGSI